MKGLLISIPAILLLKILSDLWHYILKIRRQLTEEKHQKIVLGERIKDLIMKEKIEHILRLWKIEPKQILQIYSSAWEVNNSYVMKVYQDTTSSGDKYTECDGKYFFLSKKLPGSNKVNIRDTGLARQMGCAIAQLHKAFLECEKVIDFEDNGLLMEMQGWIKENLVTDKWNTVNEDEYVNTTL